MKKLAWMLALLSVVCTACGNESCQDGVCDLSTTESKLVPRNFGEIGGMPWIDDGKHVAWSSVEKLENGHFGRVTGSGDFRNIRQDIVACISPLATAHGHIYVSWGAPRGWGDEMADVTRPGDELDSFGYDIEIGNFCAGQFLSKRRGDILIASMPTAGDKMQGGIAIWGWNHSWKSIRELKAADDYALAGTALATGDVNGDGKLDLIYASTPLTPSYDYLPGRVSVALDICNRYGKLPDDVHVEAQDAGTLFGERVEVAALSGSDEIVITDALYAKPGSPLTDGAVYFYKMVDGKLVESRPALYGTDGAAISEIAFSDVDDDGDLDLIVGQPLYAGSKKREGRVSVLTNRGAGQAFRFEDTVWSATSGMGNSRLGSTIVAKDVNADGRVDLVVGAPGYRASGSNSDRAQGSVSFYLGTGDGSIFSAAPYWRYVSDVPTEVNDDFGRSITVADLDQKGWLDLIIGSPNLSTDRVNPNNYGRVDTFISTVPPCYTADKCLIGTQCYDAGAVSDDSRCMICDPARSNFTFSPLECAPTGNECVTAVCDEALGCVENNAENGTSCGESSCTGNLLDFGACTDGVCRRGTENCGNYRCSDAGTYACMASCTTDNDCYAGRCIDGACVVEDASAPVIVVKDFPTEITACTEVTLDASQSYDADGGEVTYMWWSPDVDFHFVRDAVTSSIAFKAPCELGTFTMHLAVVDDEGLTSTRDFVFESAAAPVTVVQPKSGERVMKRSLDVAGAATPQSDVDVVLISENGAETDAVCHTTADGTGNWICHLDAPETIPAGNYTVRATASVNGAPMTLDIPIELAADAVPDENGDLQTACSAGLRAPKSGWWIAVIACFALIAPLRRKSLRKAAK